MTRAQAPVYQLELRQRVTLLQNRWHLERIEPGAAVTELAFAQQKRFSLRERWAAAGHHLQGVPPLGTSFTDLDFLFWPLPIQFDVRGPRRWSDGRSASATCTS